MRNARPRVERKRHKKPSSAACSQQTTPLPCKPQVHRRLCSSFFCAQRSVHSVLASAQEVMFSPASVCLFACLLTGLCKTTHQVLVKFRRMECVDKSVRFRVTRGYGHYRSNVRNRFFLRIILLKIVVESRRKKIKILLIQFSKYF